MSLELIAQTRKVKGKAVKAMRREGEIPGVVYGHGFDNLFITIPYGAFQKVYKKAGESTLIDLVIDGKKVPVLVQDVATDALRDDFIHVDFLMVRTDEKITAEIPLKFVGESLAVKDLQGVLVRALTHVKVECFPQDLVSEILVDISPLKTFGDKIAVRDLVLSDKIRVLDRLENMVANVIEPRKEEEVVATATDIAAAEKAAVEGIGKVEKKDKKASDEEEADGKAEVGAPKKAEKK